MYCVGGRLFRVLANKIWDRAMLADLALNRIASKEDMTCVHMIFHPFLDIPLGSTG